VYAVHNTKLNTHQVKVFSFQMAYDGSSVVRKPFEILHIGSPQILFSYAYMSYSNLNILVNAKSVRFVVINDKFHVLEK